MGTPKGDDDARDTARDSRNDSEHPGAYAQVAPQSRRRRSRSRRRSGEVDTDSDAVRIDRPMSVSESPPAAPSRQAAGEARVSERALNERPLLDQATRMTFSESGSGSANSNAPGNI